MTTDATAAARANGHAPAALEALARGDTEDLADAGRGESAKERTNAARGLLPREGPVPRQPATGSPEPDRLRTWCTVALWAIAGLIALASAASFAQSYRGLWLWALHHSLAGFWAAAFPAQIDLFIAVGELALFAALVLGWRKRSRVSAWCVTLAGLAVSVAGNVGHVAGHDLATRATAAVPPVAATAALAVGLGVLKRLVRGDGDDGHPDVSGPSPDPVPDGNPDVGEQSPPPPPDRSRRRQPRPSKLARAVAVLKRNPGLSDAEVMRRADVSASTVQRARKEVT